MNVSIPTTPLDIPVYDKSMQKPSTVWRYRDLITGKEFKIVSTFDVHSLGKTQAEVDAAMVAWVKAFWRHAEYILGSAEPYDRAVHNGLLSPPPIQNMVFRKIKPCAVTPPPRRVSVFINRKVIRKPIGCCIGNRV